MKTTEKISRANMIEKYNLTLVLANTAFSEIMEKAWDNYEMENGSLYYYVDYNGDETDSEISWENPKTDEIITDNQYWELDDSEQLDYDQIENEQYEIEVYQYFIIDSETADFLCNHTDEIVVYFPDYDLYFWGVTDYGTPWSHVYHELTWND